MWYAVKITVTVPQGGVLTTADYTVNAPREGLAQTRAAMRLFADHRGIPSGVGLAYEMAELTLTAGHRYTVVYRDPATARITTMLMQVTRLDLDGFLGIVIGSELVRRFIRFDDLVRAEMVRHV